MREVEVAFMDSNVLIYTQSLDEPRKKMVALQLLDNHSKVCISTQVLNEVSSVLIKKKTVPLYNVRSFINALIEVCSVMPVTNDCILRAFDLMEIYGFSYYDSMILAAALKSRCTILYSEDMSDGLLVEGQLRIVNPFRLPS